MAYVALIACLVLLCVATDLAERIGDRAEGPTPEPPQPPGPGAALDDQLAEAARNELRRRPR
jgi:hypothetical protein